MLRRASSRFQRQCRDGFPDRRSTAMWSSSGVQAQPSLTIASVWCELGSGVQDPFVIKA